MIVEVPKNSTNKYEYDPERIPGTLGKDGDPLDVLTLVDEPSYPGMLIEARPVGMLE